jgi:hypothetical protein
MSKKPEEERKTETEGQAGDDGEIECRVFAAMDDIAREAAKTEGESCAQVQDCAGEKKYGTKKNEDAAEVTRRIHGWIVRQIDRLRSSGDPYRMASG